MPVIDSYSESYKPNAYEISLVDSLKIKKSLISNLPIKPGCGCPATKSKKFQWASKLKHFRKIKDLYQRKNNNNFYLDLVERVFNTCTVDLTIYATEDKIIYEMVYSEGPYGFLDMSSRTKRYNYISLEVYDFDFNLIRYPVYRKFNVDYIINNTYHDARLVYRYNMIVDNTSGGVNKYDHLAVGPFSNKCENSHPGAGVPQSNTMRQIIKDVAYDQRKKRIDNAFSSIGVSEPTRCIHTHEIIGNKSLDIVEDRDDMRSIIKVSRLYGNIIHTLPRDVQLEIKCLPCVDHVLSDAGSTTRLEYIYKDGDKIIDRFVIDLDNKIKRPLLSKGRKYAYKVACSNIEHSDLSKSAFSDLSKSENYCIIKLLLLDDSLIAGSNENKLRTNKCIPVCIARIKFENDQYTIMNFVSTAKSSVYMKNGEFIYQVDKVITIDNFNTNLGVVCVPGIHFFNTIEETGHYMKGNYPFTNSSLLTSFEVPDEYFIDSPDGKTLSQYKSELKTSLKGSGEYDNNTMDFTDIQEPQNGQEIEQVGFTMPNETSDM